MIVVLGYILVFNLIKKPHCLLITATKKSTTPYEKKEKKGKGMEKILRCADSGRWVKKTRLYEGYK